MIVRAVFVGEELDAFKKSTLFVWRVRVGEAGKRLKTVGWLLEDRDVLGRDPEGDENLGAMEGWGGCFQRLVERDW